MIYYEKLVRALNQKKIKVNSSDEKKAFLKCLSIITGFVYIPDWELNNLVVMCFEKLCIGLNIYESIWLN